MNDTRDWSEEFTGVPTLFNASESKILVGVSAVETVQYWLREQYLARKHLLHLLVNVENDQKLSRKKPSMRLIMVNFHGPDLQGEHPHVEMVPI